MNCGFAGRSARLRSSEGVTATRCEPRWLAWRAWRAWRAFGRNCGEKWRVSGARRAHRVP
jgi:hypothetical protein